MYDLIIVGAGTAGIGAYKEAIKHTQNILIINDGSWDTTCARVGCMPSKVLISSANRMHDIHHADEVGLEAKSKINTAHVMPHVRRLRDQFVKATLMDVKSWNEAHKISGQAHFIDANTIEVNSQHYQAKSFIVAVGSTPSFDIKWKKELQDRLITSDDIFELETLPNSLAVVGSGVIALELAQAMQRLNVKTTIFARSQRIGNLSSPELQKIAQQEFAKELSILYNTLPEQVVKTEYGVKLSYQQNGKFKDLEVDYLLMATGRRSLLNTLKLDQIHSDFKDTKNLPVHPETKQLAEYPIFIVGDAYTDTPIQHEAAQEGKLAVHNCLSYPHIQPIKLFTPLSIVFSQPEMAIIGKSYQQLVKAGSQFVTGEVFYEKQGRAIVLGKNIGKVEVYVDKQTKQLLGAELLVNNAEHFAHLLNWMMAENITVDHLLAKPFYHPTMEEGLRTALKHARRQLNVLN